MLVLVLQIRRGCGCCVEERAHTLRREHVQGRALLPNTCNITISKGIPSTGDDCVLVGSSVAPLQHALKLLVGPRIQINGFDSADVCAHTTVNTRASTLLVSEEASTGIGHSCLPDANKDAQVPAGPSRVYRDLSASTILAPRPCIIRLFLLQSAQLLFPSNLTKLFNVCWFCIVLSGPAGLRDMMAAVKRAEEVVELCGCVAEVKQSDWYCARGV